MLNPFPIQFLALFAYFLLRTITAIVLLVLGYRHFKHRHELTAVLRLSWWPFGRLNTLILITAEFAIAFFLLIGYYTQYAALALLLMSIKFLVLRGYCTHHSLPSRLFYLLLLGISLSLFITGAGVFAFDLPF